MNIIKLYRAMDTILPEHVNLEEENGRLYFCLYRFHEWPEYKLFWIPLEFTERLPEKLGRIALEFIRQLARHHGIPKSTDTSYYEMAHDYLEDYRLYDEEATAGEIRRKAALARLYEKGKAHRILKRMDNPKGFLADLEGKYGNTIQRRTMSGHCWNCSRKVRHTFHTAARASCNTPTTGHTRRHLISGRWDWRRRSWSPGR